MIVEFTPVTVEARIYETGSYKERSRYAGSFVLHIIGNEAHVTLLTGVELDDTGCYTWTKNVDSQMKDWLRRQGIRFVSYECKGRRVKRDISTGHEQAHG